MFHSAFERVSVCAAEDGIGNSPACFRSETEADFGRNSCARLGVPFDLRRRPLDGRQASARVKPAISPQLNLKD